MREQQLPGLSAGKKTIPVEVKSWPSDVRLDTSRVEAHATPDQQLKATVKPDQIAAQLKDLPPVSGEAKVTVDQRTVVDVHEDAEWVKATARAEAKSVVASIPLSSSGARPGAVSMPGAASNPGAK